MVKDQDSSEIFRKTVEKMQHDFRDIGVRAQFRSKCTGWSSKRPIYAFCHFFQTLKVLISYVLLHLYASNFS